MSQPRSANRRAVCRVSRLGHGAVMVRVIVWWQFHWTLASPGALWSSLTGATAPEGRERGMFPSAGDPLALVTTSLQPSRSLANFRAAQLPPHQPRAAACQCSRVACVLIRAIAFPIVRTTCMQVLRVSPTRTSHEKKKKWGKKNLKHWGEGRKKVPGKKF